MARTAKSDELPKDRASILLVDDRPDKHVVYRSILEELGQNLVTANSGEEALRQVLKAEFAVILLDVNMPGMDGLETAELIRSRQRSAHVPIIFITADYGDEVRMAKGYSLGAALDAVAGRHRHCGDVGQKWNGEPGKLADCRADVQ